MREIEVDVAVVGAGTAGLTARRAAEKAGADVVMIDPGPYGTTCARVGCMPSKLLIAAADAAHHAREAHVFGVDAAPEIDGRRVMARVRAMRDGFVGGVLSTIDAVDERGGLLRGRATLRDAQTLDVALNDGSDAVVQARKGVVLATGSAPFVPPPFDGLGPDVLLDNAGVFELDDLPESLLVVGAGVIGLELGQAFARLGVRTTLISVGGGVGPLSDPKLIRAARAIFAQELDAHFDVEVPAEVEPIDSGGVRVTFTDRDSGERRSGEFERVLVAAGRRPNVSGFGLEALDLPRGPKGVPVVNPHTLQIGDSNLFLAGDANNDRPLLHEAADEGRIAGANAASFPDVFVRPRSAPLGVVFTDPQLAVIGQPWSTMDCDDYRVGSVDYGRQGRARVMHQARGSVRIYGRAGTGELLGAEMVGPRAEHMAHLLAWAVQQRMTVDDALKMPFYHPTLEEGLRTALRDLQHQTKIARPVGDACSEFGPGV